MTNNRLFPKSYAQHKQLKEKINYLEDGVKRRLQRFPYRYRFAKSFDSINTDEAIAIRTLIGYEAGMKVFLAYTCYEQIVFVANNLKINSVKSKALNQIPNDAICEKLIGNKKFMKMIHEVYVNGLAKEEEFNKEAITNNTHLTNSLEKLLDKKSVDILCIAYAIRNLYAHGEFTGGGAGVTNNKIRKIYYDIAEEVLNYSEGLHSLCVNKINSMR
jgi:hypothetical protein